MNSSEELTQAIIEYHAAVEETGRCAELCLSHGHSPEAIQIMNSMYLAQERMFLLAGVDVGDDYDVYHK